MYTCRTCKLLKPSQVRREISYNEDGSICVFNAEANSVIDIMADWHCPYFFWHNRPEKGCGCKHWINMNGKHWL